MRAYTITELNRLKLLKKRAVEIIKNSSETDTRKAVLLDMLDNTYSIEEVRKIIDENEVDVALMEIRLVLKERLASIYGENSDIVNMIAGISKDIEEEENTVIEIEQNSEADLIHKICSGYNIDIFEQAVMSSIEEEQDFEYDEELEELEESVEEDDDMLFEDSESSEDEYSEENSEESIDDIIGADDVDLSSVDIDEDLGAFHEEIANDIDELYELMNDEDELESENDDIFGELDEEPYTEDLDELSEELFNSADTDSSDEDILDEDDSGLYSTEIGSDEEFFGDFLDDSVGEDSSEDSLDDILDEDSLEDTDSIIEEDDLESVYSDDVDLSEYEAEDNESLDDLVLSDIADEVTSEDELMLDEEDDVELSEEEQAMFSVDDLDEEYADDYDDIEYTEDSTVSLEDDLFSGWDAGEDELYTSDAEDNEQSEDDMLLGDMLDSFTDESSTDDEEPETDTEFDLYDEILGDADDLYSDFGNTGDISKNTGGGLESLYKPNSSSSAQVRANTPKQPGTVFRDNRAEGLFGVAERATDALARLFKKGASKR